VSVPAASAHTSSPTGLDPPKIAVEVSLIGMLRLLEHGDFLGLFSTLMADYAKRFGLVTITHEGTFWDAEAGLAYMRTNRPARMIESFKSMVRAAVSA
jgi:hypothetical protein